MQTHFINSTACLGRIPEQATVGQRMMAEMTCEREEQIRKTYQGSPWH
jgi:hypothetical protein